MKIFELNIPKLKYSEFLEEITNFLSPQDTSIQLPPARGKSELQVRWKIIFTPNPEICLATLEDEEFLKTLSHADFLTSDGIWLYLWYQINDFLYAASFPNVRERIQDRVMSWGEKAEDRVILWKIIAMILLLPYFIFNILFRKKYLYEKYWDRICGSDLTRDLVNFSEKNNIRIAILDPYFPQDAQKCLSQEHFVETMKQKFPDLKLDFYIYKPEDKEEIFEKIQNSDARILFSTLWMKKQEFSVLKILDSCPNLKLWLGVGSSFDYFTGFQKRAPKIWRTLGFEWLYRIFTSPGKIKRLKRICQAVIIFPLQVLSYKNK